MDYTPTIYLAAVLRALTFAMVVALAVLATGCGKAGQNSTTGSLGGQVQYKRLIVVGDSIGVGIGTTNALTKGYAYLVAYDEGLAVVNLAVGGTKASDAVASITSFEFQPGDKVIWLSGYNDMRANGLDPDKLDAYYETMLSGLTYLSMAGIEVQVGTCLAMLPNAYGIGEIGQNQGSDEASQLYASAALSAAYELANVHVINTHLLWKPDLINMNADLQHPNDLGAEQLAQAFESY